MSNEVKTSTLKRLANQVRNSRNQEHINILGQFLNEKPIKTTYLIERRCTLIGMRPFVSQLMMIPRGPSVVPFYEHIAIVNLTPECKVTLSAEQVALIEQVL